MGEKIEKECESDGKIQDKEKHTLKSRECESDGDNQNRINKL